MGSVIGFFYYLVLWVLDQSVKRTSTMKITRWEGACLGARLTSDQLLLPQSTFGQSSRPRKVKYWVPPETRINVFAYFIRVYTGCIKLV
jgi:hypothetical protein